MRLLLLYVIDNGRKGVYVISEIINNKELVPTFVYIVTMLLLPKALF